MSTVAPLSPPALLRGMLVFLLLLRDTQQQGTEASLLGRGNTGLRNQDPNSMRSAYYQKQEAVAIMSESSAPWEIVPSEAHPADIFVLEEIEGNWLAEYGITKGKPHEEQNTHQLLYNKICAHESHWCRIKYHRCLTCTESWYMVQAINRFHHRETLEQSVLIKNNQLQMGVERLKRDRLDVDLIVPYACLPERIHAMADRLHSYRNFSRVRLLLTNFICDDETQFIPSDKLEADLLQRIGWTDPSQVQVLEPNDLTAQFSRAKALNILHRACRSDATVLSLDIDIEVRPPAFDHIRSLVIPGVSMYFPIVWSLYNPENVESIQEKLYGKKRLSVMSVYSGVWRKFGYGIYAIAGSDAKAFHLSETFTTWGGEDDDFFSRMQQKLHIIRAKDPHLIHHWHPEHCDVTQKSCFMSKATLEGSSLAFQVSEYSGNPTDT